MTVSALILTVALQAAASPQTAPPAAPETLQRLLACRQIASAEARLRCFDREAGAFDQARSQGEVVVVDRATARETRRQLFGFQAPALPQLFGGREEPAIEAVETTLAGAVRGAEGKWLFRLSDGAEWRQIDSEPVTFRNTAGQPVRIRRAALGSYLLTVGGSRAVRVRRQ